MIKYNNPKKKICKAKGEKHTRSKKTNSGKWEVNTQLQGANLYMTL